VVAACNYHSGKWSEMADPRNLRYFAIDDTWPLASAESLIVRTLAMNGWCCIYTHLATDYSSYLICGLAAWLDSMQIPCCP